ncbi:MAG: 6-phosphogluconolactonase [Actinomycetota bacterium]
MTDVVVRRLDSPDDLGPIGAAVVGEALELTLAAGGRASLACSGGSTPWPVYETLSEVPLPWERIDVLQVDERVAPDGDDARNLVGLRRTLTDRVPAVLHPLHVDPPDPSADAAVLRAAAGDPPVLDVVVLGVGDDAHIASLVPGDPVLDVADQPVALTGGYKGYRRVTLTYPVLDAARLVVVLVTGMAKADAVAALLAADPATPAGRLRARRLVVVADADALSHADAGPRPAAG